MIIENEYKTIMDAEEYDKLLEDIQSVEGKFVVLLKDTPCTVDGRECTIEKGSLARINTIEMYRADYSEDDRNLDNYIDTITFDFLKGENSVSTVTLWSEDKADEFKKDEDCIDNLYRAMQYLNDTFGTAPEIDKIGYKIANRKRNVLIGLFSGIAVFVIGLLTTITIIIGRVDGVNNINKGISLFFIYLLVAVITVSAIAACIDINFFGKLTNKSYCKLWHRYDNIITDVATTGVYTGLKFLQPQKQKLLEVKDNIIDISDISNKPTKDKMVK